MNDRQLIKRCLRFEKPAQRELVSRYSGYLMTICRRYIRDQHYCQDVCQIALVKIFKSLNQFDHSKGALKSWMYRIVVNSALEFLRTQKQPTEEIDYSNEPVKEYVPAIGNLIEEDLLKLLNHLSTIQRTIFNLVEIEGYDHASVSELLKINIATSRSHLFRARKILSEKIEIQNNVGLSIGF